jgi:hypothetical protein
MSVFTVNMIDWFFAFSGERGKATGEAIALSAAHSGDRIITPIGETFSLSPGATAFPATHYQGVYQLMRQSEKSLVAVNLRDINESDLRQPAAIELSGASDGGSSQSTPLPFWPFFLLAALLLLLLEWFINPRMARSGRQVQPRRRHAV